MTPQSSATIRFVPIGDSYTIGTGVEKGEAWPDVLVEHLKRDGIDIELIDNPARNGWTTTDAITGELPIYERLRPTFATLFIGVNDYVQGVEPEVFRANLRTLLDRMSTVLPDSKRLLVLTIPDYSVTPTGKNYASGRDVAAGIAEYNRIIADEAELRGLTVVHFARIADAMREDASLIASDGLHPSVAGHRFWEAIIHPAALLALQD